MKLVIYGQFNLSHVGIGNVHIYDTRVSMGHRSLCDG